MFLNFTKYLNLMINICQEFLFFENIPSRDVRSSRSVVSALAKIGPLNSGRFVNECVLVDNCRKRSRTIFRTVFETTSLSAPKRFLSFVIRLVYGKSNDFTNGPSFLHRA